MPTRGFWIIAFLAAMAAGGLFAFEPWAEGKLNPAVLAEGITGTYDGPAIGGAIAVREAEIDDGGRAAFAGIAEPGMEVALVAGNRELGRSIAAERGEWLLVAEGLGGVGTRLIEVHAASAGGILEPTGAAVVLHRSAASAPPLILARDASGASLILQFPEDWARTKSVSIEAADFLADETLLSGRAAPGTLVRVYFDNEPGAEARAARSGRWSARLKGLTRGAYTLRIDAHATDGRVSDRLEVPFEQVDADAAARALLGERSVRVDIGEKFARVASADGGDLQFTTLYRPSPDQRRDASLVYPGQVFHLP